MHSYDNLDCQPNIGSRNECRIPSGSTHTTCSFPKERQPAQSSHFLGLSNTDRRCLECNLKQRKPNCNHVKDLHDINLQYFERIPDAMDLYAYSNHENVGRFSFYRSESIRRKYAHGIAKPSSILDNLTVNVVAFISKINYSPSSELRYFSFKSILTTLFLILTYASISSECVPISRLSESNLSEISALNKVSNATPPSPSHQQPTALLSSTYDDRIASIIRSLKLNEPLYRIKRASGTKQRGRKSSRRLSRKTKERGRKGKKRKQKKKGRNKLPDTSRPEKPVGPQQVFNSPRRQRLYNKIGKSFHLAVGPRRKVGGEDSYERSEYSILETKAVGKGGIVTIKGAVANKYICVTKNGKVKANKKYSKSRCRFRENVLENYQNTYESLSCKGCFLNLNKKGKVRKLKGMNPNSKGAQFLPRILLNQLAAHVPDVITIDHTKVSSKTLPNEASQSSHSNTKIISEADINASIDSLNVTGKQKKRKNRKNPLTFSRLQRFNNTPVTEKQKIIPEIQR